MWNEHLEPPWNSDYHTNINLQMNYWPATVANLAECELPLFDYMESLVASGERTAQAQDDVAAERLGRDERERVQGRHDRGEHPNRVGACAINALLRAGHAAKEIAAADDYRDLAARSRGGGDVLRDARQRLLVEAMGTLAHQRLAALKDHAFEIGHPDILALHAHGDQPYPVTKYGSWRRRSHGRGHYIVARAEWRPRCATDVQPKVAGVCRQIMLQQPRSQ